MAGLRKHLPCARRCNFSAFYIATYKFNTFVRICQGYAKIFLAFSGEFSIFYSLNIPSGILSYGAFVSPLGRQNGQIVNFDVLYVLK